MGLLRTDQYYYCVKHPLPVQLCPFYDLLVTKYPSDDHKPRYVSIMVGETSWQGSERHMYNLKALPDVLHSVMQKLYIHIDRQARTVFCMGPIRLIALCEIHQPSIRNGLLGETVRDIFTFQALENGRVFRLCRIRLSELSRW